MISYSDADSKAAIYEKIRRRRLPLNDYLYYIRRFVEIGDVVEMEKDVVVEIAWKLYEDPILGYLSKLMNDPIVQSVVLSSKLAGQIFYETMGRFVAECLHAEKFASQRFFTERKEAEKITEWSMQKKKDHWQALLSTIDEKHHDDGFDTDFMKEQFSHDGWKDPENWENLQQEWMAAIDERIQKEVTQKVKAKEQGIGGGFNRIFERLGERIRSQGMSEVEALQAWNMMDGQWIESEFEKKLHIVQIQNKYPQIGEVARKMGRLPDEDGKDHLTIQTGFRHKLDHSSGSDIEGVTIGRDLNALMPTELAQYTDTALEGLFLRKWVTSRLQVFRYKSEITKPARRLHSANASRRGPMIVCVDSSASMYGVPQKIEASLLSKLEQTAEQLKRDCFLIDFSVGIRPIELRSRRKKKALERMGIRPQDNENFEKGYFPFLNGGTDAQKMLNLAFALLDNGDDRYMNADVLWITDFLIPRTTEDLMRRFKEYQKTGTRFYGFKIGEGSSNWDQYFDKIYEIRYRPPRMY
jgi:uncharacterized protein with von Willebrand factor type A (vWA) domain